MDTTEQYKENIVNPLEPLEKVECVRWYEDPIYIKMADCEEIQEQLPELAGATAWPLGSIKFIIHEDAIYYLAPSRWRHLTTNKNFIWLPTQEDLQKMMLALFETDIYTLHTYFNEFIETDYLHNTYPCKLFTSMEQLWLAFVMKTLHSKVWSDSKWIKR